MKKSIWLLMTTFLFAICFGMLSYESKTYAAAAATGKKAILVVSFGTTFQDTRKLNIESVENKIKAAFPDYEVRRAFTSRIILKRIADNEGLKIDTEKQALDKLKAEGYSEVIVQPLHMVAGDEYDKVRRAVDVYAQNKSFDRIALGRPLIYFAGQEERPDDYVTAIKALQNQFPKLGRNEAVVLIGHGGVHPANAAYAALQARFIDAGYKNVFINTVDGEGYPSLESVIAKLKERKIKKVVLMPLMLVAGDHANNDIGGDEEDSAKTKLTEEGFKVEAYIQGLGENTMIQDIFVQHVQDTIANSYTERGKERPPIPVID